MNDHKRDTFEPFIGSADLECVLKCKKSLIEKIPCILNICNDHGFNPIGKMSLLAYGSDPIEPTIVADANEADSFIQSIKELSILRCIVNLDGVLSDTKTSMSLIFDMAENVLVISVPEDVLWGFSSSDGGKADILRLKAFARCCEVIASRMSALLGYIGTEHLHPEDMVVGDDSGASHIDNTFFSEERIQELFDWYVNFYVKRWYKK